MVKNLRYTIEYEIDALDPQGLEETLDKLREYGSAKIVSCEVVEESDAN